MNISIYRDDLTWYLSIVPLGDFRYTSVRGPVSRKTPSLSTPFLPTSQLLNVYFPKCDDTYTNTTNSGLLHRLQNGVRPVRTRARGCTTLAYTATSNDPRHFWTILYSWLISSLNWVPVLFLLGPTEFFFKKNKQNKKKRGFWFSHERRLKVLHERRSHPWHLIRRDIGIVPHRWP